MWFRRVSEVTEVVCGMPVPQFGDELSAGIRVGFD
jgi:hypothetical protein